MTSASGLAPLSHPHGLSSQAYLNRLCEQAIPERYGEAPTRAREQMRHELTVIEQMVHPYLRRREGVDLVSYLHPLLEPSLQETLGVILFQEQVLKVARDLAGFTAGQGEQLRGGLGAKDGTAAVERFRDRNGSRWLGLQQRKL